MATTVIAVEAAPNRIRGWLSVWMLQLNTGVYVAELSARVRDRIVRHLRDNLGSGNAVVVWKQNTEQGFMFETIGRRRRVPVDYDGLQLVSFLPQQEE